MERVYENTRIRRRMMLAAVAIGAAVLIGLWFLAVRYPTLPPDSADENEVLFVGIVILVIALLGTIRFGHYGKKAVVALDADPETGAARLALWRPLGEEVIDTRLDRIVDWRYEVGRANTKMPLRRFRARLEEPPQWVLFELHPLEPLHPVFGKLAPEAVEEYEMQTALLR